MPKTKSNVKKQHPSKIKCSCVKSKCLLLYCDCFHRGLKCKPDECTCIDCKNTELAKLASSGTGGVDRDGGIASAGDGRTGVESGRGGKARENGRSWFSGNEAKEGPTGCACDKSKCLKKYCVCFAAEVECGPDKCKCKDCKNPFGSSSKSSSKPRKPDASSFATATDTPKKPRAPPAFCTVIRSDIATRKVGVDFPLSLNNKYYKNGNKEIKEGVGEEKTKTCQCVSSQCLKLYCDCFRQSAMCNEECKCKGCKNTEEFGGEDGERTKVYNQMMEKRPELFRTPKKKSGVGCSCAKNKCRTGYCDCKSLGIVCDPAVCSCINCDNMMQPLSEMPQQAYDEDEDENEVFLLSDGDEEESKIKNLQNYVYLIDDFEERRIANPSQALVNVYSARDEAAAAAKEVIDHESEVRKGLEMEIKQLEKEMENALKKEEESLKKYREKTNKVLCLEMEEPCRWTENYKKLKHYVMKTGDLPPPPSSCTSEPERRLSIWVQEMKSLVYSQSERIIHAPHRVEALEMLGVEWIETEESSWNRMFDKLCNYKRQNKTVRLPSFIQCRKSKDQDLISLRHWVDKQEQDVRSGAMAKRRDRLNKLQALGLPFKLTWEQEWDYNIVELLKFRSKFGHCFVNSLCKDHPGLDKFVLELLKRMKKDSEVKLTKNEKYTLREKGLMLDLQNMLKNPTGRPPANRNMFAQGAKVVPLDHVKEVNYWAGMLEQLKAYKKQYGTLEFPPPEDQQCNQEEVKKLKAWVEKQKWSHKNNKLHPSRVKELHKLGLELDCWGAMFKALRKYKREAGTVRLPRVLKNGKTYDDNLIDQLGKWVHDQIRLYRRGDLEREKRKLLRNIGVPLTKAHLGTGTWEERFDEMLEYYHKNKTCLPRREGPLRDWVIDLVTTLDNNDFLSDRRLKMIEEARIGPYLKREIIFADDTGNKKRKADSEAFGDAKKSKLI